jgi:fructokinase
MMTSPLRIGIDLGGTKTEIIALDAAGRELLRRRRDTPQGDYAQTLALIAAMVGDAERELGAAAGSARVGIGMPGTLSAATGLVKNANSTCLIGRPLQQDLEARLGRAVRLANDANCFALSEATDGAGAGAAVVFGVILGTGVGGGIVVHGRVLTGANAIAGEWGHNPLPLPAGDDLPLTACYCGRAGCIETYLSGPALARDHARHQGRSEVHAGAPSGAAVLTAAQVAEGAARGDAACEASLARYEQRLARSLAQVINILDPEVIVLGGGLSGIARLYDNVPRLWVPQVFSDRVDTRLVRNRHGDSSGVRGAAWLWGS